MARNIAEAIRDLVRKVSDSHRTSFDTANTRLLEFQHTTNVSSKSQKSGDDALESGIPPSSIDVASVHRVSDDLWEVEVLVSQCPRQNDYPRQHWTILRQPFWLFCLFCGALLLFCLMIALFAYLDCW